MPYTSTIELFKEDMKFSAGHFTVFSATERERLHGHNFKVRCFITLAVSKEGLTADYKIFKTKVRQLCNSLDEYFLIPFESPYLQIADLTNDKVVIKHATDELIFLKKDVLILPITNTTVEEFARYFVTQLITEEAMISECNISAIEVKVASGDGQNASFKWEK
jgi:6-pyruvoyltetrahydropterin/6-carboxytetrahydropterin synthase